MTETVNVNLGVRSYPICIGPGAWSGLLTYLDGNPCTGLMTVTDMKVDRLYGEPFARIVEKTGIPAYRHVVPEGETSKSFGHLEALCVEMAASGMDRQSTVLALGGGVVGDLAGMAASVYLRGVRLIQLPTTLLSMVDSSVGGKTGINIAEGKNLVGTFYQPEAVLVDTPVLQTLHERDWYSGLAEVIKIALTLDKELFGYLESIRDLGPSGDLDVERIVADACLRKAEIVESDERETGLRRVLNFGHTLGHGVEAALGYGTLKHGEAILLGMKAALNLSRELCGLQSEDHRRAMILLDRIPMPDVGMPPDLTSYILRDKKSLDSRITGVFVREIGKYEFVELDDPEVLVRALEE